MKLSLTKKKIPLLCAPSLTFGVFIGGRMRFILLLVLFVASPVWALPSQENCTECHGKFKKTAAHQGVSCNDCHTEITTFPHKEKSSPPTCSKCHSKTANSFEKSAHNAKGLDCIDCHKVHSGIRITDCTSCHSQATHKNLPSRAKHLASLNCIACHGIPEKSGITATVKLPAGALLNRKDVDNDGNGFIDKTEWHTLEYLLEHKFPGSGIDRQYWSYGNIHSIRQKPADCSECHDKRTRFATAAVKINGESGYSIQIDPGIFIPEFPSLRDFKKTVHGKQGVTCTDCHTSQEKISDGVCSLCHENVYHTYKSSLHGKQASALCTDCHNPHLIKSYKEYNAKERGAVCSRCHKDYLSKHKWLPNTTLHFKYLECTSCHSPGSEKSMVFFFQKKSGDKKSALTYGDFEEAFGRGIQVRSVINKYTEQILKGNDIGNLLNDLNKKMNNGVSIDAEIVVTKVHHDYSVTRLKEKNCVVCHSSQASFYNSIYLNLPGKEEHIYAPVKGTLLSTYPLAMAMDIYLLGEQKITKDDIYALIHKAPADWTSYIKGLGFKLIDMAGICLLILALLGCMVHALLRILVI